MKNFKLMRGGPWGRLALAIGIGLVGAAALSAATRIQLTQDQYRLEKLRERESQLRGEVEMLRIEVSALRAPDRVEAKARARGFGYPEPEQVIWLTRPRGPVEIDVASRGPR